MAKMSGLGRGLNALFDDNMTDDTNVVELRLSEIEPNRDQPRKDFDDEALKELCDSILEYGVLQPLLVRPMAGGGYQLVAGERRWRASRMAGLTVVPVIVKELSDGETVGIALVENLQRQDLNPIEEAEGYKSLISDYEMTQEEVARRVGKSRSTVANAVRILTLPNKVLEKVKGGTISSGHARALLALEEEKLDEAIKRIENGANVREIENLAKEKKKKEKKNKINEKTFITEAKISLKEAIGRRVDIKTGKNGRGSLVIEYFSEEDLKSLINLIGNKF